MRQLCQQSGSAGQRSSCLWSGLIAKALIMSTASSAPVYTQGSRGVHLDCFCIVLLRFLFFFFILRERPFSAKWHSVTVTYLTVVRCNTLFKGQKVKFMNSKAKAVKGCYCDILTRPNLTSTLWRLTLVGFREILQRQFSYWLEEQNGKKDCTRNLVLTKYLRKSGFYSVDVHVCLQNCLFRS